MPDIRSRISIGAIAVIFALLCSVAATGCSSHGAFDVSSPTPSKLVISAEDGSGLESRVLTYEGRGLSVSGEVEAGDVHLTVSTEYSGEVVYDQKLASGPVDVEADLPDSATGEGVHVIVQAEDATCRLELEVA